MSVSLDGPAHDLVGVLREEATRTGTGDPHDLARRLYGELRALARGHRARWDGNHTLNTMAVVHEAYLRLVRAEGYQSDTHFLCVASRATRQVLINYARDRSTLKRGGRDAPVALHDAPARELLTPTQAGEWLDLDDALDRLAAMDARAARVVEIRAFGGLTLDEAADALGVSESTVTRDWRRARAWLRGELGGDLPAPPVA